MLPSLFISHGSPQIAVGNNPTATFLEQLPSLFCKPKYILVISAHWLTKELTILSTPQPDIIYDFYGFEPELYEQTYQAKNDMNKVNDIEHLLKENNITVFKNETRGYDHGVWIPLKLMYPKANIPIIQLSLPINYGIDALLHLGEVLQILKEDTLIISSGSMTHNLQDINWNEPANITPYAQEFTNWIVEQLKNGHIENMKQFMTKAPSARKNHPTLEHILPLFISLGASQSKRAQALNDVYMYGNQSMEALLFKE